jgi:hypothetical protein
VPARSSAPAARPCCACRASASSSSLPCRSSSPSRFLAVAVFLVIWLRLWSSSVSVAVNSPLVSTLSLVHASFSSARQGIVPCCARPGRCRQIVGVVQLANRIWADCQFSIRHGTTQLLDPISKPPWHLSTSGPSLTHPCARSSSIGFRACSCLRSSHRTRHPLFDPHLTSSLQT